MERTKVYRVMPLYDGGYEMQERDVRPQFLEHLAKTGWRLTKLTAKYAEIDRLNRLHYSRLADVWNAGEAEDELQTSFNRVSDHTYHLDRS